MVIYIYKKIIRRVINHVSNILDIKIKGKKIKQWYKHKIK